MERPRFRSWKEALKRPTKFETYAVAVSLIAAAVFFFIFWIVLPFLWHLLEAFAYWADWRIVVLVLVLTYYVYSTADLWHKVVLGFSHESLELEKRFSPERAKTPVWRKMLDAFSAGLILSLNQALEKLPKTFGPPLQWVWTRYLNLFHPSFRALIIRSTGVFAIIWVSIYAILFFANFWPYEKFCAWQFPKILSCLLGANENLAAGLIGAGGAIYAGWIAWIAVQQQIEEARKNQKPSSE